MQYDEAIGFLYERLPMFTRDGVSAFKKDLTNTLKLCEGLGNPQLRFQSIHVAGTNGKGSTSHMLAAILQTAGYKTGLYTSPHLLDFRERIRINGEMVPQGTIAEFVNRNLGLIERIQPSFFEVTVAMAFEYFAHQEVDVAVIETGMGGRLDSTNVVTPLLSVITNIGYDHMNMLGNTLREIAGEKAGIIKPHVPVVVGEWQEEINQVFADKADELESQLTFASQLWQSEVTNRTPDYLEVEAMCRKTGEKHAYLLDLKGGYQAKNLPGVLCAVEGLKKQGFLIADIHIKSALKRVQPLTGLMGRWQTWSVHPLLICDTGHNEAGWCEVLLNIKETPHGSLHMVIGVMRDKDLDKMLPLLPREATYYFCQVDMPRALPAPELEAKAKNYGLQGVNYASVAEAVSAAQSRAKPDDLIFVGGSTFVVAELLELYTIKEI